MAEDESGIEELRRQLRQRMDDLDARHRRLNDAVWYVAAGNSLGVALLVLTATTWQVTSAGVARNAWRAAAAAAPEGYVAPVAVVVLAVGTLAVSIAQRVSTGVYRWLAASGVLTVLIVLLVASSTPRSASTSAGLWLTGLAALALAVMHANRSRT